MALADALALSQAMVAAARAGEWARVAELDAARAPLWQADLHAHAQAAEILPRLADLQRELTTLVAAARDGARGELVAARRGHAAASAYLEAADDR